MVLKTKFPSDIWCQSTWEEYLQIEQNPNYEKTKVYYYQGQIRIEMSPLGNDHSRDHNMINYAINLYASTKEIKLNGNDNCTYVKTGYQSAQPDLSYYISERVDVVPYNTGIVDLDTYPAPNLVIEIANTSLSDDLGIKRLLYENLGCQEYWVVDVQNQKIIAFVIKDGGSKQITHSPLLGHLEISILEEALRKTRQQSHSQVGAWLLQQFQN